MTLELLVALSCTQREACPELSKAYYASRPAYKAWAYKTSHQLEQQVGREFMVALPVALTVATHKPFQLRIYKNLTCGHSNSGLTLCVYNFNY